MVLPGVAADRVDAVLLAATDNFATAVAAAIETGAELIEPSHLLIALARLRGGLTRSLFAAADIPVEVFVNALRNATVLSTTMVITACTEDTISPATREALGDLVARAPAAIGEGDILAALLSHLEPAARQILVEHGGVDLARWIREVTATAVEPAQLFDADGRLATDAFTPAARAVLANLVIEASAFGHREPGTLLLLHAMALAPQGLIARAALILRFNLRELRAQVLIPLRGRTPRHVVETTLDAGTITTSLRQALERAAANAAGRSARLIAEQDLLIGLLDSPAGLGAAVLSAAGFDVAALRQYAGEAYTESVAPAPPGAATMSVQESLDWLRANLIGQDGVVDRLLPRVELIKRAARRGFRMGERPLATFLFCGPSGTGKTMTARLLAKVIYGSTDDLLEFEMGQFNTHYSINTFIGAPPGYVGFGEGQLTNGLLRQPRSVLLFDEVEKADPLVFDALMRLLDEGRVNDPAGPVRDARDTVIVLTSNLGADEFAALGRIRNRCADGLAIVGPTRADQGVNSLFPSSTTAGDMEEDEVKIAARLRDKLGTFLRPEFLNRIDETILFEPFGPGALEAIARARLRERAEQVKGGLGLRLSWDADVPGQLVRDATRWRADEAARGINRCVDEVLQVVLRALDDAEDRGEQLTAIRVVVRDGQLAVESADA
ncbi:MAG: AAA family ATPase [Pseudonocardiaceae bacterium]